MTQQIAQYLIVAAAFLFLLVSIAIAIEVAGRTLRCDWCSMPYAYWKSRGGRCCRKHKAEARALSKIAKHRLTPTIPYRPRYGRTDRKLPHPIYRSVKLEAGK